MDLLITAARKKFRFPSSKGPLQLEQLWDLPLTAKSGFSLDAVAQDLDQQLQATGRTSFVDKGTNPEKTELEQKLQIVVGIIETIQAENAALRDAAAKRAQKTQLLEILHDKKKSELLGLSAAEIEERIKALEA